MEPVLRDGDIVLADPRRAPRVGDVVVCRHPHETELVVVKRVAAITDAGLVLHGDAPHASTDSRSYGPVPHELLLGVVTCRHSRP